MPETSQQSLLRRMFGNSSTEVPKEPGMLQRMYNAIPSSSTFLTSIYGGMNKLSDAINNPALIESILGPNQMLNIQDEKLDPNLVLGRNIGPISKSYGASGNWQPNMNKENNQLTPADKIRGMAKLRQRGID